MEIKKDKKTGIIRHTYGTVYPVTCRVEIIRTGYVRGIMVNGRKADGLKGTSKSDEVIFDVSFQGEEMNIISTETRTIIVGMNEKVMFELFKAVSGPSWEYDDLGNRNDFL